MRSAETVLGIIHDRGSRESTAASDDTGEPGAPKGARPVRGGADGKVLASSNSLAAYSTSAGKRYPA